MKALVNEPQDRSAAARELADSLGGKLLGFWYAFGEFDGVFLMEAPDNASAAAAGDGHRRQWSVIGGRDHRSARYGRGPGCDAEGRRSSVPAASSIGPPRPLDRRVRQARERGAMVAGDEPVRAACRYASDRDDRRVHTAEAAGAVVEVAPEAADRAASRFTSANRSLAPALPSRPPSLWRDPRPVRRRCPDKARRQSRSEGEFPRCLPIACLAPARDTREHQRGALSALPLRVKGSVSVAFSEAEVSPYGRRRARRHPRPQSMSERAACERANERQRGSADGR